MKTLICPSADVTLALRGLEGDGREVDKVALALERLAAWALLGNKKKPHKKTTKNIFTDIFIYIHLRQFEEGLSIQIDLH